MSTEVPRYRCPGCKRVTKNILHTKVKDPLSSSHLHSNSVNLGSVQCLQSCCLYSSTISWPPVLYYPSTYRSRSTRHVLILRFWTLQRMYFNNSTTSTQIITILFASLSLHWIPTMDARVSSTHLIFFPFRLLLLQRLTRRNPKDISRSLISAWHSLPTISSPTINV
jgi:hypothetical protein